MNPNGSIKRPTWKTKCSRWSKHKIVFNVSPPSLDPGPLGMDSSIQSCQMIVLWLRSRILLPLGILVLARACASPPQLFQTHTHTHTPDVTGVLRRSGCRRVHTHANEEGFDSSKSTGREMDSLHYDNICVTHFYMFRNSGYISGSCQYHCFPTFFHNVPLFYFP